MRKGIHRWKRETAGNQDHRTQKGSRKDLSQKFHKIHPHSFYQCRLLTNEHHKSAITDHVCQNSHIMNWEASEIVEEESDKFKRWIKEQGRGSLSAFSQMDTSDRHSPNRGGGASTEWLCVFIAIIDTFRSLFKVSDTFDDFQVLITMADNHRNCHHH